MSSKEMLDNSVDTAPPEAESAPRSSHGSSRFTGDDAQEDGERLVAALEVTLEDEAERLRKKIIKVEQLGYACPRSELVEARRRLAEIDKMLSD